MVTYSRGLQGSEIETLNTTRLRRDPVEAETAAETVGAIGAVGAVGAVGAGDEPAQAVLPLASGGCDPVDGVDQLAEAAVVGLVEPEDQAREVEVVAVGPLGR